MNANATLGEEAELGIGQVASAAGVGVSTIRYYDELGLITPARRVGGKRRFDPDVVARLTFVRRAQLAGFSLDDIKSLLDDQDSEWPEIVELHLGNLRRQREQLDVIISALEEAHRCGCDVVAQCPRMSVC